MDYIRIKNWSEYQHYKDRSAPWIKLHKELLSSHFWVMANDASKLLAICIMLLAQRNDNKIPHDSEYIKRFGHLESDPNLAPLLEFELIELIDENECLQDASKILATCYPEGEGEGEKEKPFDRSEKKPSLKIPDGFNTFWQKYPRKVAKPKAIKSWMKINPDENTLAIIISAIDRDMKSDQWKRDNGQFIPHPATWLNNMRWEDEEKTTKQPEEEWSKETKAKAFMWKMSGLPMEEFVP